MQKASEVMLGEGYAPKGTSKLAEDTTELSTGKVQLGGLKMDSKQGDKVIVDILRSCGVKITVNDSDVEIEKVKESVNESLKWFKRFSKFN